MGPLSRITTGLIASPLMFVMGVVGCAKKDTPPVISEPDNSDKPAQVITRHTERPRLTEAKKSQEIKRQDVHNEAKDLERGVLTCLFGKASSTFYDLQGLHKLTDEKKKQVDELSSNLDKNMRKIWPDHDKGDRTINFIPGYDPMKSIFDNGANNPAKQEAVHGIMVDSEKALALFEAVRNDPKQGKHYRYKNPSGYRDVAKATKDHAEKLLELNKDGAYNYLWFREKDIKTLITQSNKLLSQQNPQVTVASNE